MTLHVHPLDREPCQWYALCENEAEYLADAGPLGFIPACGRCLEVVGMSPATDAKPLKPE